MKHPHHCDNTLAVQDCTAYRGTLSDQGLCQSLCQSHKMPDKSIMLRILIMFTIPQTAADLAQICQELAGDYDTIFYASFDNRLILDLVASSHQHLMSFDDGYADIYPFGYVCLAPSTQSGGLFGLDQR